MDFSLATSLPDYSHIDSSKFCDLKHFQHKIFSSGFRKSLIDCDCKQESVYRRMKENQIRQQELDLQRQLRKYFKKIKNKFTQNS